MQLASTPALDKQEKSTKPYTYYQLQWLVALSIGFLIDGTNRESTEEIIEPIMQKSADGNCLTR